MSIQAQALEKTLREMRETIGKAHEARRDLRTAIKDSERLVPDAVFKEVGRLIEVIADEVRDEMHRKIDEEIERLGRDLRSRLGL